MNLLKKIINFFNLFGKQSLYIEKENKTIKIRSSTFSKIKIIQGDQINIFNKKHN